MPVYTDRVVMTEKWHDIAIEFSKNSIPWSSGTILLSTQNSIVLLRNSLTVKSYTLINREVYTKALAKSINVIGASGTGLPKSNLTMGKYILQNSLYTNSNPKLISETISFLRRRNGMYNRSHGAIIALHLEACRGIRNIIYEISNEPSSVVTNYNNYNKLIMRWKNLKLLASRLGLSKIINFEDI